MSETSGLICYRNPNACWYSLIILNFISFVKLFCTLLKLVNKIVFKHWCCFLSLYSTFFVRIHIDMIIYIHIFIIIKHFYYIFFIDEWYKYLIKQLYQTELKPVWFKAAPWLTPMYWLQWQWIKEQLVLIRLELKLIFFNVLLDYWIFSVGNILLILWSNICIQ